jgi:hypothetical protein
MNTPEWFGTIGVMNSQHLHRRGVIGSLRRAIGELGAAAACLRFRRALRPSQARSSEPRRQRAVLAEQPIRSA